MSNASKMTQNIRFNRGKQYGLSYMPVPVSLKLKIMGNWTTKGRGEREKSGESGKWIDVMNVNCIPGDKSDQGIRDTAIEIMTTKGNNILLPARSSVVSTTWRNIHTDPVPHGPSVPLPALYTWASDHGKHSLFEEKKNTFYCFVGKEKAVDIVSLSWKVAGALGWFSSPTLFAIWL